jgi:prophage DNA circulation protein
VPLPDQPWRRFEGNASFRGVAFHVDTRTRASGRRIAMHEYPKRDIPYAEDMGRRARKFPITGYLIGPDYLTQKNRLIEVFEAEGPGLFQHPALGSINAVVDSYTVLESRERGGMCNIEVQFCEAGLPGDSVVFAATQSLINAAAASLESTAASTLDANLAKAQ